MRWVSRQMCTVAFCPCAWPAAPQCTASCSSVEGAKCIEQRRVVDVVFHALAQLLLDVYYFLRFAGEAQHSTLIRRELRLAVAHVLSLG